MSHTPASHRPLFREILRARVTQKWVTLSVDSWTNLTNHPIVGAAVDEHLLLLEDTLGTPHTGEFMATMIMSAAATAQRDLGCKVASVVTDNASNMKSARTICEQNGASFITYPCLAHCLNNLVKDLMADKGRGEVLKAVTEVIVKFRNIQKIPCASPHIPQIFLVLV